MKEKKNRVLTEMPIYKKQDPKLPQAIIVDIDGTIALINDRSPFDHTKWHQDLPHLPIIRLLEMLIFGFTCVGENLTIIFMTGREGSLEQRVRIWKWLMDNLPTLNKEDCLLYTRSPGDYRGDVIVKKELFEKYVEDQYYVNWIFEDRNKMVNFWRNEMHLPTLPVKDGDY